MLRVIALFLALAAVLPAAVVAAAPPVAPPTGFPAQADPRVDRDQEVHDPGCHPRQGCPHREGHRQHRLPQEEQAGWRVPEHHQPQSRAA